MRAKKESGMVPGLLASAVGWLVMFPPNQGTQEEEQVWGVGKNVTRGVVQILNLKYLWNIQIEMSN